MSDFDKRLMDIYLGTETNLCPRCGRLCGDERDDELIMWKDHTHDKWCAACRLHFRLYALAGRAVSVEIVEWDAT